MAETDRFTGPQHYRQAELLLASINGKRVAIEEGKAAIAAAQVHATLALAAATASGVMATMIAAGATTIEEGPGTWHEVITGGGS